LKPDGPLGLDAFDGPLMGADDHLITLAEGLAQEDQQAREPVLKDVLEREADQQSEPGAW
jgi:hypothetical protein